MVRKDHMAAIGNDKTTFECDSGGAKHLRLLDERCGVQDHAASDHAFDGMKNTRGDQMQDIALSAEADRVSGVMAALKAGDAIEVFGQDVHNLALAFVSPLQAYDC